MLINDRRSYATLQRRRCSKIAVPEEGLDSLFGTYDENLKHLESLFNVRIRTQGNEVIVEGDAGRRGADRAHARRSWPRLMRDGYRLANGDVKTAAQLVAQDDQVELRDYFLQGGAPRPPGKRQVAPKSVNQRRYLDAIDQHDIVFGIGPAGTGKTYLAMAQAVAFLLAKKVSRIILARPAVEAGEKLGFLPGDLQEKVNPYLRPLYDALYDMMEVERVERLLERGTDRDRADRLHARPDAERRVRDPRRGAEHDLRADEDVPDAPRLRLEGGGHRRHHADRPAQRRARPGLVEALKVVAQVEGISFIHFDDRDVVRHQLVQQIVKAYEAFSQGGVGTQPVLTTPCHLTAPIPVHACA